MGYGLFGKAPQKRDFLSLNMPNAVLHPFETWLQSAVAASRSELGRDWENYYLVAPIWRFWLGREVLGTPCMGAVMSSLDQVGRYFPLAIVYYSEPGEELVPPLMDAQAAWFEAIEQRLLAVLSRTYAVDVSTLLDGLLPPNGTAQRRPVAAAQPLAVLGQSVGGAAPEPIGDSGTRLASPDFRAPPPAASPLPAVGEEDIGASAGPAEVIANSPASDLTDQAPASGAPWDDVPPSEGPDVAPIVVDTDTNDNEAPASGSSRAGYSSLWDDPAPAEEGGAAPASLWGEQAPVASPEPAEPEDAPDDRESDWQPTPFETGPEPEAATPPPQTPPAMDAEAQLPRVIATPFKGGLSVLVEGEIDEPGPRAMLLDQDHLNAAAGRSYWWCRLPAMGASRAYLKQGLPDAFFYSRMLLWEPPSQPPAQG